MSLTTYVTEQRPNGERKVPERVCGQRVSGLLVHVLLGFSLKFAPALRFMPQSVLYGVFLNMGISSLHSNSLFDRLLLWCVWDPVRYPQFEYVQLVSARRVHAYAFLQAGCLAALYAVKTVRLTAVLVPSFMSLIMVGHRLFIRRVFSEEELLEEMADAGVPATARAPRPMMIMMLMMVMTTMMGMMIMMIMMIMIIMLTF